MSTKTTTPKNQPQHRLSINKYITKVAYATTIILILIFTINETRYGITSGLGFFTVAAILLSLIALFWALLDKPQTRWQRWFVNANTAIVLAAGSIILFGLIRDLLAVRCGFAGGQISCLDDSRVILALLLLNPFSLTLAYAVMLGPWAIETLVLSFKKK